MAAKSSRAARTVMICTATVTAVALLVPTHRLLAQGSDRTAAAAALFNALDDNKDAVLTGDEMRASVEQWFSRWVTADAAGLSADALIGGLSQLLPAGGPPCGGRSANPQTPCPADVTAMVAALPATAPAKPKTPRKVLVLARAAGFVHSSIPLAARTIEEMGKKTGAWTTTITYDAADITAQNLTQYDAIFLASTTGHFLDDPNDAAATAARRTAFLEFVRGGKGIAAIHAASDAYHESAAAQKAAAARTSSAATPATAARPAGPGPGLMSAIPIGRRLVADGDRNADGLLSRDELTAVSQAWFAKVDTGGSGRVTPAQFTAGFGALVPPPPARTGGSPVQAAATQLGPDDQVGTWPEFNTLIGGFFKFHWNDGQEITYMLDDPSHPLNAPFRAVGAPFVVADETYTFGRATYSRRNLRVLTSVDYAKMSDADKAKEQFPRSDGDHPLSWVRREGQGRVFYMSHGHNEKIYANTTLMTHLLYGVQYALGDLPADDSPSQK